MLELQSLQKEQQRHEQLLKIQQDDECSIEVTVPLRKVAANTAATAKSGGDDAAACRLNNNRDSFHFENDANNDDDDVGTTVADDIVLVKGDRNNESTLSHRNRAENDTNSATITVNIWHFYAPIRFSFAATKEIMCFTNLVISFLLLCPFHFRD